MNVFFMYFHRVQLIFLHISLMVVQLIIMTGFMHFLTVFLVHQKLSFYSEVKVSYCTQCIISIIRDAQNVFQTLATQFTKLFTIYHLRESFSIVAWMCTSKSLADITSLPVNLICYRTRVSGVQCISEPTQSFRDLRDYSADSDKKLLTCYLQGIRMYCITVLNRVLSVTMPRHMQRSFPSVVP